MTTSATPLRRRPVRFLLVVLPILLLLSLLGNDNHGGPDVAGHAQEQQRQQRDEEQRSLSVSLDPKTVDYKPSSVEDQALLEHLKRTENIWGRGYLRLRKDNLWGKGVAVAAAASRAREEEQEEGFVYDHGFTVCDRPTRPPVLRYSAASFQSREFERRWRIISRRRYRYKLQQGHQLRAVPSSSSLETDPKSVAPRVDAAATTNAACPAFDPAIAPLLLLEGLGARGRTGNNLVEFLHAVQYARDHGLQLGTESHSWAMNLITSMWFEKKEEDAWEDWYRMVEGTFCMKVFRTKEELEGWNVIHMSTSTLFSYMSKTPMAEYIPSQLDVFRKLYSRYNTGTGTSSLGTTTMDMCKGVRYLFPTTEERRSAIYTVIHSRSLEGASGTRILGHVAKKSGCDKEAALEMAPDYIKGILGPLNMLNRPIILITDGRNAKVVQRLQDDPDIGPVLRVLDKEASSVGGDITLAVMANVFIGNPASSFTSFIVKSRLALGFGHNELYYKMEKGRWHSVCGDHCIFDFDISGSQA